MSLETGAANALIRRGWKKTDLPRHGLKVGVAGSQWLEYSECIEHYFEDGNGCSLVVKRTGEREVVRIERGETQEMKIMNQGLLAGRVLASALHDGAAAAGRAGGVKCSGGGKGRTGGPTSP